MKNALKNALGYACFFTLAFFFLYISFWAVIIRVPAYFFSGGTGKLNCLFKSAIELTEICVLNF